MYKVIEYRAIGRPLVCTIDTLSACRAWIARNRCANCTYRIFHTTTGAEAA